MHDVIRSTDTVSTTPLTSTPSSRGSSTREAGTDPRTLEELCVGHTSYGSAAKGLLQRATGRFYTSETIGRALARGVFAAWSPPYGQAVITVIDPFCGDGRLVAWALEEANALGISPTEWRVALWDTDADAVAQATLRLTEVCQRLQLACEIRAEVHDTFLTAPIRTERYDVCVTNPPWEVLKPDSRETSSMSAKDKAAYTDALRAKDRELTGLYTNSVPTKRFSGWGLNLARCGVEVSLKLTATGGVCGIVSPASLFADQTSQPLRKWLFSEAALHAVHHFPAEMKEFEGVDQPCANVILLRGAPAAVGPYLLDYRASAEFERVEIPSDVWANVRARGGVLPMQFGVSLMALSTWLESLPLLGDLEGAGPTGLWAGRELDETGYQEYLCDAGEFAFVKGKMVTRFALSDEPKRFVMASGPRVPSTASMLRLGWRDVARQSQKRRMHAALIPAGHVTGNSLSVAFFRDGAPDRLIALLAIFNSLVFEAQARMLLATAHVSLGAVRQVRVPSLDSRALIADLERLVARCTPGDDVDESAADLEARVAVAYGLNQTQMGSVLAAFDKLSPEERARVLNSKIWNDQVTTTNLDAVPPTAKKGAKPRRGQAAAEGQPRAVIPNHVCGSMSALDLQGAVFVPPGGNWKDIPESVPSKRLQTIRDSFARGEGSRSTYYGRLRPDAPSYTINTYFCRPGNGCHLHYDFEGGQHRTMSLREAARFQSFPDEFVFHGAFGAICDQIGNAVPPLLAYQIAEHLGVKGAYVDLFAGAGGLGFGFKWAGWTPVCGNDISDPAMRTYAANVHAAARVGNIRDEEVVDEIVNAGRAARTKGVPLFVLGGPPCQGFSTAGKPRTMEDDRNWLFEQYRDVLKALDADGFVFENVSGLLNMEGGRVFAQIKQALADVMPNLSAWVVHSEDYALPQRRTRVIIVGMKDRSPPQGPPPTVTSMTDTALFVRKPRPPSAEQAIGDLPPLAPSEDGSSLQYVGPPGSWYQALMRGQVSPAEYLHAVSTGKAFPRP